MKLDWKPIAVALVLGIVVGAFAVTRGLPRDWCGGWKNPQKARQHMMQQFTSKLNLTSDQQQKISVIFEEARAKMNALREEMRPKFQEIRTTTKAQIRALLTPDQQARFDKMNAEREARMQKHHPGEWGGKD